ncbi:MAG: NACHT domain-containing protein, partial [Cyanobacteria bacterium J06555_13]
MTAENQKEGPLPKGAGDRSLIIEGSADESLNVVGDRNTIQHVVNVFSPITVGPATSVASQSLSKQEYRWRQVLVDNVKHYWIEGVLKKSLHNQALIELGLEERLNAVASPLRGVGEFPDEPSRSFPDGTQAPAIFDDLGAGRTLLILGEPGAGKTTTLLKLVESLL